MNKQSFLTVLAFFSALILSISSCKKDDDDNDQTPIPPATVVTTIGGRVTDETGNPIPFAKISCANAVVNADSKGFYLIKNISVPSGRAIISYKNEYFRTIKPLAGTITQCDVTINKKYNDHQLNGATGGTVTDISGVSIIFQSGSLLKSDGNIYSGNAIIRINYLNPSESSYFKMMPAHDNLYIDENGNKKFAYSFGTTNIQLIGTNNQLLKLDANKPATLSIPINSSGNVPAPTSVKLSSFDSEKGIWKPEATAMKSGNNFVGQVSHFSLWGAITPLGIATVRGYVKDISGNPIPNASVRIGGYISIDKTDASGLYVSTIYDGYSVSIESDYEQNMGIFSPTLFSPVLTNGQVHTSPDIILNNATIITGNIVDCNGNNTLGFVTTIDTLGNVIYTLASNSFSLFTGAVKTVNLNTFQGNLYGDSSLTATASGTITVVGNLPMCNFISTSGNVTFTFTSPTTGTSSGSLQLAYADITYPPLSPFVFISISSEDSIFLFGLDNYLVGFVIPMHNNFLPGTMPWTVPDTASNFSAEPIFLYGDAWGISAFNYFEGYGIADPQNMGTTTISQIGPVGSSVIGSWTGPILIYNANTFTNYIHGTGTMTFNVTRRS